MDRIQAFLDQCIRRHEQVVKEGGSWADERYWLGKITALRTVIQMYHDTESTVPANLIA